jgi:hypothetical protein
MVRIHTFSSVFNQNILFKSDINYKKYHNKKVFKEYPAIKNHLWYGEMVFLVELYWNCVGWYDF